MALIDKLNAIGDAIREKNSTTDLIPLADMPQAILNIIGDSGIVGDVKYKSIVYNDDDTITLIDADDIKHTMVCAYENGKLVGVTYDDKPISLGYIDNALNRVGATEVDLGGAKTTGLDSVDHTVKFLANGSPYEVVSVKHGNLVNKPSGVPISEAGTFTKWLRDGVKAEFPFVPQEDVTINALFQKVRYEMELLNAGDIVYTTTQAGTSPLVANDYKKVNDGLAIVGYTTCIIDNMYKMKFVVISPTSDGCVLENYYGQVYTHNGTIQYGDMTYYYFASACYTHEPSNYGHAYDTELEVNDAELIARRTLDYYFIKI